MKTSFIYIIMRYTIPLVYQDGPSYIRNKRYMKKCMKRSPESSTKIADSPIYIKHVLLSRYRNNECTKSVSMFGNTIPAACELQLISLRRSYFWLLLVFLTMHFLVKRKKNLYKPVFLKSHVWSHKRPRGFKWSLHLVSVPGPQITQQIPMREIQTRVSLHLSSLHLVHLDPRLTQPRNETRISQNRRALMTLTMRILSARPRSSSRWSLFFAFRCLRLLSWRRTRCRIPVGM